MSNSLNADFTQPAVMETAEMDWQPSPSPTVWRKRLDLLDGEFSRVTSVVRYDADSSFRTHDHPDGEEILVLEGIFSDEFGDYPAGTYLLNPQGFRHTPFSKEGCVIFVKLRQFVGEEREHVVIDSTTAEWRGLGAGVERLSLYQEDGYPEDIMLLRLASGAELPQNLVDEKTAPQGLEFLVISGRLASHERDYGAGAWRRQPSGWDISLTAKEDTTLYLKRNHLQSYIHQ